VSKRHLVPASFVACISQLAALALPACADPYGQIVAASASAGDDAGDTTDSGAGDDAGIPIDVEPDPWLTEVYAPVQQQAAQMSVDAFLQEYPQAALLSAVSYDPTSALHLPEIAAYTGMSGAHDKLLAQNGFVAVAGPKALNPATAYHEIYYQDLPVLITTDSLLFALHASFDSILLSLELRVLIPRVDAMLKSMHERLAVDHDAMPASLALTARDLDVYLAVARGLLSGGDVAPITGADASAEVERIRAGIKAETPLDIELFGVLGTYDFSQFKPRGHYTDTPELQRYFKAMMWLGRTEMPMITFDPSGEARFNRRGLDAAFATNMLLGDSGASKPWAEVDRVLERLIGERDNMNPTDMSAFMAQTGIASYEALAAADRRAALRRLDRQPLRDPAHHVADHVHRPHRPADRAPARLPAARPALHASTAYTCSTTSPTTASRTCAPAPRSPACSRASSTSASPCSAPTTPPTTSSPSSTSTATRGSSTRCASSLRRPPRRLLGRRPSTTAGSPRSARSTTTPTSRPAPEAMRTAAWADKTLNTQTSPRGPSCATTPCSTSSSPTPAATAASTPTPTSSRCPGFYERLAHLGQLGAEFDRRAARKDGFQVDRAKPYFFAHERDLGSSSRRSPTRSSRAPS
jgi:hypothetical protein